MLRPVTRVSSPQGVRRLARARVPLGFAFAVVVYFLSTPTRHSLVIGVGVAVVGELLRVWAAGHLNKSREVTVSGPYRWFAHPLYVGSSIMGAGLAIASASVIVALIIAAYLIVTIGAAVRSEEAFLREKFGDRYHRYRSGEDDPRVRAEEGRRFSIGQAMANREYRALGGLIAAILLLLLKANV